MPRREFQKDLASASTPGLYPHLSNIARGDDDGSFVFVYTPPFSTQRVGIHVSTLPDCSEYPEKHRFFAFSGDDSIPDSISTVLSEYQPSTDSPTIDQFLQSLNSHLNRAVFDINSPNDASLQDCCNEEEADDGDDWEFDNVESPYQANPLFSLQTFQYDIRTVKAAGYKAGRRGNPSEPFILSISCRIKKLSLPSDVLRAWNVTESEYLVLLIRYPRGYLPMKNLILQLRAGQKPFVEMRVGLCESYKPSLTCALQQFEISSLRDEPTQSFSSAAKTAHEPVYRSLLIGSSLSNLLNHKFLWLLRYRLDYGLQWGGAEDYLWSIQGKAFPHQKPADQTPYPPDTWPDYCPSILKADHLRGKTDPGDCVFPLAAIQFVLRRFVKCTEFCLTCYRKIYSGFEAIKPYVCSDGLCLYQYVSLGMGASVEWEILTQPSVVDLLISLTYFRAMAGSLADFPSSIGLKVTQEVPFFCSFDPALRTINVRKISSLKPGDLKPGDCLLLKATASDTTKVQWHCIVESVARYPYVEVSEFIPQEELPKTAYKKVELYLYNRDFDKLQNAEKRQAINCLLDTLPSVDKMREFVTDGLGHSIRHPLSSWAHQVSPSALYLLRWIIASNRSYIVHEDDGENMVSDMAGFTQFRIAQGTPDKEARFVQAVRAASCGNTHKQKYPTLFAWHGSNVANWHSILREGLHFKQITNGRSKGNGVYMASNFETSISYTGQTVLRSWPQSQLDVKAVMSLNEVVNSPEEFVWNADGVYVVRQLDWIQMRYLFVSSNTNEGKRKRAHPKGPSEIYRQDPTKTAMGPTTAPIKVPISATKTHRTMESHGRDQKGKLRAKMDGRSDTGSVATLEEDVELLKPPATEDEIPFKIDTSKTDFQPGTINESSLKLLGPPTYATDRATRALHKHLRETLKVQKTEFQHELGWYIDPILINNVYQWIVELHSFDPSIPLAADLKRANITSIVTEIRFPPEFPLSPPFVRIIRPRLLRFLFGGGGHVTAGGSMCMELLTSSGWLATFSMESVLLQVRLALSNLDPRPARLDQENRGDYGVKEAVNDFRRVCGLHGWKVPGDLDQISWS